MASPNLWPGGLNLAGTVFANGPATLQRAGSVYLSGSVQWVDTISGNNANAGTEPELPVATLAQAVTNSGANGTIIVGAGSAESLSGSQSLNIANLKIFGCGAGSSRPRYTCTGAVEMWASSQANAWIEGFYFPASTAAATSRVSLAANESTIKDCYFECGANDSSGPGVLIGGDQCRVVGCTFAVTASRPGSGIHSGAAVTGCIIEDCTFNGGSYGWASYALRFSASATRVKVFGGTYTNHSDIGFSATATSYDLYGIEMDGTSRVLLTA